MREVDANFIKSSQELAQGVKLLTRDGRVWEKADKHISACEELLQEAGPQEQSTGNEKEPSTLAD